MGIAVLVFQWRRQARDGLLVAEPTPEFVPVRVADVDRRNALRCRSRNLHPPPPSRKAPPAIEIEPARRHPGAGRRRGRPRCPAAGAGGAARVIPGPPPGVRVWLAAGATDPCGALLRRAGAAGAGGARAGSVSAASCLVFRGPPRRSWSRRYGGTRPGPGPVSWSRCLSTAGLERGCADPGRLWWVRRLPWWQAPAWAALP